jgi:hypothetical protein
MISKYKENHLIVKLATKKTDCKAKELCGVPKAFEPNF